MREVAGLLLVLAVLLLAPAFYFSSMIGWVVAIALAIAGLLLFYSGRRARRDRDGPAPADERFDGFEAAPLNPRRWRRLDSDSDSDGADGAPDGD
jgi:hypothetical protein